MVSWSGKPSPPNTANSGQRLSVLTILSCPHLSVSPFPLVTICGAFNVCAPVQRCKFAL